MTNDMSVSTHPPEPWIHPWPEHGLESVERCPICGASSRNMLHSHLVDDVFWVAPGKWNLWQCADCKSAYLDPRPSADTIYLAYENYYTHTDPHKKAPYESLSRSEKLRQRLVNGYTNWRYATRATPFSRWGVVIALLLPNVKGALDRKFRHLPRLPPTGGTLLDVGCGSGAFLNLAKSCGWDVVGLDPDPIAVAHCTKQGLNVETGGLDVFAAKSDVFDVITLNHVIEHTPDPIDVLCRCHSLLKAGGQLWLETPNIESFGHSRFQRHWRGLETPRHLVLLNPASLRRAMIAARFQPPHNRICPGAPRGIFTSSHAIALRQTSATLADIPRKIQLMVMFASVLEKLSSSRREFLTVTATSQ